MTSTPENPAPPGASHSPEFAATRWSIVVAAADLQSADRAREALSELAQAYWFPLYAYLRRQGKTAAEAEDLTQAFFTKLIEKNTLSSADRTKGKFRSFLLTTFRNFVINEYEKNSAQKRGGGNIISLDPTDAEDRYHQEPANTLSPERVYEQRWAWAVLDRAVAKLRKQYEERNQAALFDALKNSLIAAPQSDSNAEIAQSLGMSVDALNVAVHRLRKRYRDLARAEIAQTVADPSLIDEEIQYLLSRL